MIVAFLLMSVILMMSIQTSMATEKDIMSNDVIKQAFDNNVNKISLSLIHISEPTRH